MLEWERCVVIDLTEIRSLTEFVRHSKECVGKIKRKKSPMVLTVNGKAELVVQDAESYQAMLEKLSKAILGLGLDYQVVEKQKPKFKYQFNETTIKQVSELKDPTERAEILRAISSIAVAQAKLDVEGNVLDAALEILREEGILNSDGE